MAEKKQINLVKYQTSDKRIDINLLEKNNKISLTKTIDQFDGSYRQIKSTYEKSKKDYYQKTFMDKTIIYDEGLIGYKSEEIFYDKEKDSLKRLDSIVIKKDDKVISKSNSSTIVDKSEYVIYKGLINFINNKENNKILVKANKLVNKLVKKMD